MPQSEERGTQAKLESDLTVDPDTYKKLVFDSTILQAKDSIFRWTAVWIAGFSVFVAAVGFFGANSLIEPVVSRLMLREQTRIDQAMERIAASAERSAAATALAQQQINETEVRALAAGETADRSAKELQVMTSRAIRQVNAAIERTTSALEKAQLLDDQSKSVQAGLIDLQLRMKAERESTRTESDKAIASLQAQLKQLEIVVTKIADESKLARSSTNAIQDRLVELEQIRTKALADRVAFLERSQYSVTVYYDEALSEVGARPKAS
jgi:hypothetical protein